MWADFLVTRVASEAWITLARLILGGVPKSVAGRRVEGGAKGKTSTSWWSDVETRAGNETDGVEVGLLVARLLTQEHTVTGSNDTSGTDVSGHPG